MLSSLSLFAVVEMWRIGTSIGGCHGGLIRWFRDGPQRLHLRAPI